MIARALTDEAFRTRLEQDPRETIETEFQCKVSGDVTFRVREEENPGEMTILLPKLSYFGVNGVFWAEAISNVIGGIACYGTMYVTVYRPLGQQTG